MGQNFDDSEDEVTYCGVAFEDDILSVAEDVMSARVLNVKVGHVMEGNQLRCHPHKRGS